MTISLTKRSQYFGAKFDSARDEVVYELTLDGMLDSSGDSDAPTGWFSAISIGAEDIPELLRSEMSCYGLNDMVSARESFADLVGHFLIVGDSQGFIYVIPQESAGALDAAYAELDALYSAWADQDEDSNA